MCTWQLTPLSAANGFNVSIRLHWSCWQNHASSWQCLAQGHDALWFLSGSRSNWLLNSFPTHESSGTTMKNLCLTLALFEMPTSPEWIFISLIRCSHAWSTPMDTKGLPFFMTAMLPDLSSDHACMWCILASHTLWSGQRRRACSAALWLEDEAPGQIPGCNDEERDCFHSM